MENGLTRQVAVMGFRKQVTVKIVDQKRRYESMSEKCYTKEPLIHSHIEDSVSSFTVNKNPKEPCTYCVACDRCGKDVQSGWECMETWVETEFGNYCTKCWHLVSVMEILEDNFAKGDNV